MEKKKTPPKTGPEPARVKISTPWEKAVSDALKKQRPEKGWPEEPKPSKKKPA
jgi:hypothetical protein